MVGKHEGEEERQMGFAFAIEPPLLSSSSVSWKKYNAYHAHSELNAYLTRCVRGACSVDDLFHLVFHFNF